MNTAPGQYQPTPYVAPLPPPGTFYDVTTNSYQPNTPVAASTVAPQPTNSSTTTTTTVEKEKEKSKEKEAGLSSSQVNLLYFIVVMAIISFIVIGITVFGLGIDKYVKNKNALPTTPVPLAIAGMGAATTGTMSVAGTSTAPVNNSVWAKISRGFNNMFNLNRNMANTKGKVNNLLNKPVYDYNTNQQPIYGNSSINMSQPQPQSHPPPQLPPSAASYSNMTAAQRAELQKNRVVNRRGSTESRNAAPAAPSSTRPSRNSVSPTSSVSPASPAMTRQQQLAQARRNKLSSMKAAPSDDVKVPDEVKISKSKAVSMATPLEVVAGASAGAAAGASTVQSQTKSANIVKLNEARNSIDEILMNVRRIHNDHIKYQSSINNDRTSTKPVIKQAQLNDLVTALGLISTDIKKIYAKLDVLHNDREHIHTLLEGKDTELNNAMNMYLSDINEVKGLYTELNSKFSRFNQSVKALGDVPAFTSYNEMAKAVKNKSETTDKILSSDIKSKDMIKSGKATPYQDSLYGKQNMDMIKQQVVQAAA